MRCIGVIPARMASARFPGKPLASIQGMPMIGHVYQRSRMSQMLDEVYIATCDESIRDYAEGIGAPCIMTAETHERASDRAAEATVKIEEKTDGRIDVVMMVQGDEPLLQPYVLDVAVEPFQTDPSLNAVNLIAEITTDEEFESPNIVKVVVDRSWNALYMSREPIPSRKKCRTDIPRYKQLGLIAFRRDYLSRYYNELTRTRLEIAESIDMLRVLEHGDNLRTAPVGYSSVAVDTPENLKIVQGLMANDVLAKSYLSTGCRQPDRAK